jgi:hypothetical protein
MACRRRLSAGLASVALLAPARGAFAQQPLSLEWRSAPECASREVVLNQIARMLDGQSAGHGRRVEARVSMQRTESGTWRVALASDVDGTTRLRSFEAESCEAAVDAVTLILAVAIDPRLALQPPAPSNPPSPPASPPSTPAQPDAPTRLPPRTPVAPGSPSGSPLPLSVAASFVLGWGALPRTAAGAEVALALSTGRLRFEIAGTYWAPQKAYATGSSAGATFRLLSGDARVAVAWPLGAVVAAPFVGAGLESLDASGFGGTLSDSAPGVLFAQLAGGAILTWRPAEPVVVRLGAESDFPLSHPSFVVVEPAPAPATGVHRVPAVSARAMAGAGIVF